MFSERIKFSSKYVNSFQQPWTWALCNNAWAFVSNFNWINWNVGLTDLLLIQSGLFYLKDFSWTKCHKSHNNWFTDWQSQILKKLDEQLSFQLVKKLFFTRFLKQEEAWYLENISTICHSKQQVNAVAVL